MTDTYDLFIILARERAEDAARLLALEDKEADPRKAAFAAFCTGVQFALELSALSPQTGRQLIYEIHRHNLDCQDEWNVNAQQFINEAEL